ncbi:sigma54 specific transcriptional regulator, Fis family [Melioribacter roseus P3M-2]|uniref:Sigma54 specific transcriptional regulator, Fis family n=1 Tax=Melioribacter roseus (strain DSM 23840 / JCM 17771 / VKM B-2668 / P3M-2) TaxID=1191523 RepID=I7A4M7_MELRP|nr:sigma-54 dependent transcriptional regulator [Melioribacter roseus]AFN74846.1 sigma54 specific transcriptional regulator, Fis family [Melioribacter roseus P3M-2]
MQIEEFQKKYGIIGKSKEIRDLIDITMQVAQSDITVLITGESGVGKEVFARAIHGFSKRSDKPLVSVNCGAIPETLLESELFGHKKGSFTGATDDRKGYFEIADGGTLFLDEIAEMALTTQVKLLRVLETKEFMPIGSETVTKVDVRIIAATNKDLQKEVDAKKFRNDLYFRLKAVTLFIPPLRKRKEDILDLANHFLKKFAENNQIKIPLVTKGAEELLVNYNWPGNIRELKNVIETAAALCRDGIIDEELLKPLLVPEAVEDLTPRNLPVHLNRSPEALDREMIYRALIEIKKDLIELKNIALNNAHENNSASTTIDPDEVIPLEELEKRAIINAIKFTGNNRRKAARLLKISERTLYRKLKEYGIQ